MKRLLSLLAALALALSCGLTALAEEKADLEKTFVQDWLNFLLLQETRLGQQNKALKQMVQFSETGAWDDLVRARAMAAYATEVTVFYANKPFAPTITYDEIVTLAGRGMDIEDAWGEFTRYEEETRPMQQGDVLTWQNLHHADLYSGVYDPYARQDMATGAKLEIEINEHYLRYWYLVTNFIALQLPQEYADVLWENVNLYLPEIAAMYDAPFENGEEILALINADISRMEERINAYKAYVADREVTLNTTTFSEYEAVTGMPVAVPAPVKLDGLDAPVRVFYYWVTADGETIAPSNDMTVEKLPTNVAFRIPAAEEYYRQYIAELAAMGFKHKAATDTAAQYAFENGAEMLVYFEDATLTIAVTGQISLMPYVYYRLVVAE